MTRLVTRNAAPRQVWQLEQQGLHPLLARLYAARGFAADAFSDRHAAGRLRRGRYPARRFISKSFYSIPQPSFTDVFMA